MTRLVRCLAIGCSLMVSTALAQTPPPPPHKPAVPNKTVLARPIAIPTPTLYAKDEAVLDADVLKIINTGEAYAEGQVLLDVERWSADPKTGAPVHTHSLEPWALGHLHIIQVYGGCVFNVVVDDRKDDGSVVASYTSRGPGNRVTVAKRKKPMKAAHAH